VPGVGETLRERDGEFRCGVVSGGRRELVHETRLDLPRHVEFVRHGFDARSHRLRCTGIACCEIKRADGLELVTAEIMGFCRVSVLKRSMLNNRISRR
jgi:hypothetical protein